MTAMNICRPEHSGTHLSSQVLGILRSEKAGRQQKHQLKPSLSSVGAERSLHVQQCPKVTLAAYPSRGQRCICGQSLNTLTESTSTFL